MNLTSKRILQCVTVVASVFAFTATAADPVRWVEDSFENADGGTNQMAIALYKAQYGGENVTTNYLWVADAEDQSKIVTNDPERVSYSGVEPIAGTPEAGELVLALETEGKILSRHVMDGSSTGKTFSAEAPVYVDTLIKFTPSEDPPTIAPDVKVAVYVNENTNLVVYHKVEKGLDFDITNSVFNVFVSPNAWNRLTIQMGVQNNLNVFKVYLNGLAQTHPNAIGGGEWFYAAADSASPILNAVAFQGTGFVDELVVADQVAGAGNTAIMLTLLWDAGIESVIANGVDTLTTENNQVTNNTPLTITAKNWFIVDAVSGGDASFSGTLNQKSSSGTISAGANTAVSIASATNIVTTMGGTAVNGAKLAAWAIANNVGDSSENSAAWLDEYLLNLAPDAEVTNTIEIASITVGATEATIKVVASSTAVNFANINGTLNIYTATNLATGFNPEPVAVESLTFTENQNTNTVTVPLTAGSFIKATVK